MTTPATITARFATLTTILSMLLIVMTLINAGSAAAQMMTINYAPSVDDARYDTGLSGGQMDAFNRFGYDYFGNLCPGHIHSRPDHVIRLTQRQRNTVEAESGRDTTLVIYHRESGWRFCDDGSGFGTDALVTFRDWPIDTYDVYVGSYWRSDDHDYSLYVDR